MLAQAGGSESSTTRATARSSEDGAKRTGILLEKVSQLLQPDCMWSRNHNCCVVCSGVDSPHMAGGRCSKCYQAIYRSLHKEQMAESKRRWYKRHMTPELMRSIREERHFGSNRTLALERDGFKCQLCECRDLKKLVVHHKDGHGRSTDAPNNDLDNLQTLCRKHHIKVHLAELQLAKKGLLVIPDKMRKGSYRQRPISGWSRLYAHCVVCEKSDSPHKGRGWCNRCAQRKDLHHLYEQSPRYSLSFKET